MATAAAASSSKSDLKWRVTEIARCPICLSDCKNPKSLPCLHSFCLHCLQECWKDKRPRDRVPCPVCRKELAIPDNGLDALPHNFFVQNLIDATVGSNELGAVLCESCEKGVEESEGDVPPATVYCVDCSQKLCKRCSRPHKTWKGGPHEVRELNAELCKELIQQRGSYCDQHAGKLELYCLDCKVNVCKKCSAVAHTQHNCREVETVAEDVAKSSKTNVEQISSRINQFQTSLSQTEAGERTLTRAVEDVETSVKERAEMVKHTVDRQVEKLLEELHTFQKTSQKELACRKERLEFGVMAMGSFTAYSQELTSTGSPCDVTRAASEMQTRADELLQTYVTPEDYCTPGVKFVPTNIDELTDQHGKRNLIGSILTSKAAESDSSAQESLGTSREKEHRSRSSPVERVGLGKAAHLDANKIQVQQKYHDSAMNVVRMLTRSSCTVVGLTCLDEQLFVLDDTDVNQVKVYSTKGYAYALLRQFSVKGLNTPKDIASCGRYDRLYISDGGNSCVHKSTLNGDVIAKWALPDSPYGISITPSSNVLATCYSGRKLLELCSKSGKCIRQVELQSDIQCPWHAIELAGQQYVVSHGREEKIRVCVVGVDGQVSLSYGGQSGTAAATGQYFPHHMTSDGDNFVFVADQNSRVALLNPSLQLVRHIKLEQQPYRLYLDHVTRRLYVGHGSGDVTIIQV